MSAFTQNELNKLSVMYDGDKDRDASSKIRGFLFQDYVVIMYLLTSNVMCVCSEFLEDVDVFFDNDTFEFIQVKYYPKSTPNMKEISTDLYYQYLRLQILQSSLRAIPFLCIHGNKTIEKPTLDEMKKYIELDDKLPKTKKYSNSDETEKWLRDNVYISNKKAEQKKTLFIHMASEESLKGFLENYKISNEPDIDQYRERMLDNLIRTYPNPDKDGNDERWRLILLGLAISYTQRRYLLVNPCFDQLRMDKKDFNQYMTESTQTMTEYTIASYLVSIICESYAEIVNHNNLSNLQMHMLNLICQNTVRWINDTAKTIDGQYQLLNTFSTADANAVVSYKKLSVNERLIKIAESKGEIVVFLNYLWKIMLNICQEKVDDVSQISNYLDLFNPINYIVPSVTEYVCLHFPEDKSVNHSVILPRAGAQFNTVKRKIIDRMIKLSHKPEKWFFENSKLKKGKNYYNYSMANVNENPTVADLEEDSFYIECMNCIKIDEGEWSEQEICSGCIFSEQCIEERIKL